MRLFFTVRVIMKPVSLRPFMPRPAIRRRFRSYHRGYAVQAPGAPTLQVFNRHIKYLQKERAATDIDTGRKVDYLKDEVATRLCERLLVGPTQLTVRNQSID